MQNCPEMRGRVLVLATRHDAYDSTANNQSHLTRKHGQAIVPQVAYPQIRQRLNLEGNEVQIKPPQIYPYSPELPMTLRNRFDYLRGGL